MPDDLTVCLCIQLETLQHLQLRLGAWHRTFLIGRFVSHWCCEEFSLKRLKLHRVRATRLGSLYEPECLIEGTIVIYAGLGNDEYLRC